MRVVRSALITMMAPAMLLSSCTGSDDANGGMQGSPASQTEISTGVSSGSETPSGNLAAIEQACQEEGQLTFYGSANEEYLQSVSEAFTDEYGIEVEFIRLAGAALQERFLAETDAGTWVPDIIMTTDESSEIEAGFYHDAADADLIVALDGAEIPGIPGPFPAEFFRTNRAIVQIQPWGISYNSSIVDSPPQQWPEVLDERFRDLVIVPNPSASAAYAQVFKTVQEAYGDEWFEGFRGLNAAVFEGGVPATEALGAGEGGIQVPSPPGLVANAQSRGAPVELSVPDVTTGVEMGVALVNPAETDHPNCGKLFISFVMTPDGADALTAGVENVFSPFDTGGLPPGYESPVSITDADQAEIAELLGVG